MSRPAPVWSAIGAAVTITQSPVCKRGAPS
jgi:hypothetical protein